MDPEAIKAAITEATQEAIRAAWPLRAPGWLGVREAAKWAGVSERTLRTWLTLPLDPLPASRVAGGRLLICRRDLDHWLRAHRTHQDIDSLVDQLAAEVSR